MNEIRTPDASSERSSGLGLSVAAEARRLQEGYQRDTAASVAALARLRNALGRSPADAPDVWPLLLPVVETTWDLAMSPLARNGLRTSH